MRLDRRPRDRPRRRGRDAGRQIRVELLPTFVGCPALELIRAAVADALAAVRPPGRGRVHLRRAVDVRSDHARRPSPPCWRPGSRRRRRIAAERRSSTSSRASRARTAARAGPSSRTSSGRRCAGRSSTAATAASRSRRSSRSDRGRPSDRSSRRRGRGRDDGRRDRPARARGRPRGRPPRRRRGRHRARPRADPRRPRRDVPRGSISIADTTTPGSTGRLARLRDAPTRSTSARRRAGPRHRGRARGPRLQADDLPGARRRRRGADAILATNTSALSVAAIAERDRASRSGSLGLHFFNPAPVMPLVEVVVAPATRSGRRRARDAARRAPGARRRSAAPTRPGSSSIGSTGRSRSRRSGMLEAGAAAIEAIDEAIRAAGFPMGPFELMDLDRHRRQPGRRARASWEAPRGDAPSGSGRRRSRSGSSPPAASDGRPARASTGTRTDGAIGPAGARVTSDAARRRAGSASSSGSAIAERIIARDRQRGAIGRSATGVATAADIDLAMRLGAGHPVGPFERADELGGPASVLAALRRHATDGARFEPAPARLANGPEVRGRIRDSQGQIRAVGRSRYPLPSLVVIVVALVAACSVTPAADSPAAIATAPVHATPSVEPTGRRSHRRGSVDVDRRPSADAERSSDKPSRAPYDPQMEAMLPRSLAASSSLDTAHRWRRSRQVVTCASCSCPDEPGRLAKASDVPIERLALAIGIPPDESGFAAGVMAIRFRGVHDRSLVDVGSRQAVIRPRPSASSEGGERSASARRTSAWATSAAVLRGSPGEYAGRARRCPVHRPGDAPPTADGAVDDVALLVEALP